MFSGVVHDAPWCPNPSWVTASAGVVRPWTVPNTWMAGHLSRLPNIIGTSPLALTAASADSNSAQVLGGCTPAAASFLAL